MNGWRLFILITLISIGLMLYYPLSLGYTEDSLRIIIRLSARIAGVLFAMSFAASAVQYFIRGFIGFWLLANRRYLGLSFALIHTIHLILLYLLQRDFHPVFEQAATISLVGGGLAYLALVLMSITSFELMRSWLTRDQWRWLHTIGGYWIWYIFIRSYMKRALTEVEYYPLFILFIIVLMARIAHLISKRMKQQIS